MTVKAEVPPGAPFNIQVVKEDSGQGYGVVLAFSPRETEAEALAMAHELAQALEDIGWKLSRIQ